MDAHVQAWLDRDPDPETRRALEESAARGDAAELARAFAGRLEFGTAGLRGVLGPGPSRMNRLVVRETTSGLAAYLLATIAETKRRGVVVGYDGRKGSRLFAEDTAGVLAAHGIPAHLFVREGPTPLAAFAVRRLGAAAGVMVTASHNPPEYNGYKVYWENGAQIIPPHDKGIAAAIERAARAPLACWPLDEARRAGLVHDVAEPLEEEYLRGVAGLSLHAPSPVRAELGIAYTPLHGVGARLAEAAMRRAGFTLLSTVASQREPDGAFPTVRFPNPEEPGAMDAVLALAAATGAELACANDPDADRFAVAVRRREGGYRMLSGNEVGALLGYDRLEQAGQDDLCVTTIVSSRLLGVMARQKGARYAETLTGFKWIANVGLQREAKGERFAFGYEEALGYSVGTLVRDKDGISALTSFCELAASLRERGEGVLDLLERIARAYGLFVTSQRNLALRAGDGPTPGERLRQSPPQSVAGRAVLSVADLLAGKRRQRGGREEEIGLPPSDVLVYELEGDARVIVRPSGTEPKIKCYYELCTSVAADEAFAAAEARAERELTALVAAHQGELA